MSLETNVLYTVNTLCRNGGESTLKAVPRHLKRILTGVYKLFSQPSHTMQLIRIKLYDKAIRKL